MSSPLPINGLFVDQDPDTSSFDRRMEVMPQLAEAIGKIEAEITPAALKWLKVTLGQVLAYQCDIQIATHRYPFTRVSGGLSMGTYPCNAPRDLDLALELAFMGEAFYAIADICDRQIVMFPTRYGGGLTIRMLAAR